MQKKGILANKYVLRFTDIFTDCVMLERFAYCSGITRAWWLKLSADLYQAEETFKWPDSGDNIAIGTSHKQV